MDSSYKTRPINCVYAARMLSISDNSRMSDDKTSQKCYTLCDILRASIHVSVGVLLSTHIRACPLHSVMHEPERLDT